jgi:hypothetical protein
MRRSALLAAFLVSALLSACGGDSVSPGAGSDAGADVTSGGTSDGGGVGPSDGASGGSDSTAAGGDATGGSGHDGGDGGSGDGGGASSGGEGGGGDAGSSSGGDGGGSCGACDTPPDACHAKAGTCQNGVCVYAFVSGATCDDGNPCTVGDSCSNGACTGVPMVCDTPPAQVCTSTTTLRTYDTTGSCNGGLCVYAQHDVTCGSGGCVNNACQTDPCSGVTCNTPPSVCYTSPGTCSGGSCSYAFHSGATCDDGNACTTSDSCTSGVCVGVPMACNTPPSPTCADASTLELYSPSGTCSAGQGSYLPSFVSCTTGCASGQCKPSGWTAMASSTSQSLYSVWGSSASDVWATGVQGVAVHYVGGKWSVQSPPSSGLIWSVHGTAANDVYAIDSNGAVFHFDGTSWSTTSWTTTSIYDQCLFVDGAGSAWIGGQQSSTFSMALFRATSSVALVGTTSVGTVINSGGCSLWAVSPTDVWLSGTSLLHYDGSSLTPVSGVGAAAVWAYGSNAVYAGAGTTVSIRNGSTWTPSNTGTNGSIEGIWGSAPNRIFVAIDQVTGNSSGEVRSYDGTGWTNQPIPTGTQGLTAVWAAPTGEVFAVGYGGTILKGP